MDLKTTTRPKRNVETLQLLVSLFDGRPEPIEILEVGPGLAVKYLGRLAEEGRFLWDIFRRIEVGIRRVPLPDVCYESYETREIIEAFASVRYRLTVLDINERPLRIVREALGSKVADTVATDLGKPVKQALKGQFDLIIAQAVVGRIPAAGRPTALQNLRSMVKSGGVVFVDFPGLAEMGLAPIAHLRECYSATGSGS